jgi:hypothetical protein
MYACMYTYDISILYRCMWLSLVHDCFHVDDKQTLGVGGANASRKGQYTSLYPCSRSSVGSGNRSSSVSSILGGVLVLVVQVVLAVAILVILGIYHVSRTHSSGRIQSKIRGLEYMPCAI